MRRGERHVARVAAEQLAGERMGRSHGAPGQRPVANENQLIEGVAA